MNLIAEFAETRVAPRRAAARLPKHAHIQAVTNPSEVAICSGTPTSRIITRPEVARRTLRASRSAQQSRAWARSARERDADSTAGFAGASRPDLDLDALITQELDAGTSVDPTTPVTPQQWRLAHKQWMQQDTDLTWLLGDLALPLALLAQGAGTTTWGEEASHPLRE